METLRGFYLSCIRRDFDVILPYMTCITCKETVPYNRRDGICNECRANLPLERSIEEQFNILERAFPRLLKELPQCLHKEVVLHRYIDKNGFYWHCMECSK